MAGQELELIRNMCAAIIAVQSKHNIHQFNDRYRECKKDQSIAIE
jgi:hypothetical protein